MVDFSFRICHNFKFDLHNRNVQRKTYHYFLLEIFRFEICIFHEKAQNVIFHTFQKINTISFWRSLLLLLGLSDSPKIKASWV